MANAADGIGDFTLARYLVYTQVSTKYNNSTIDSRTGIILAALAVFLVFFLYKLLMCQFKNKLDEQLKQFKVQNKQFTKEVPIIPYHSIWKNSGGAAADEMTHSTTTSPCSEYKKTAAKNVQYALKK